MSTRFTSWWVDPPRPAGALATRLLRSAAGVLLGFLAVNAFVALAIHYSPGLRADPVQGMMRREGVFVWGTEGYCATRLNSMGLRAPEPSVVRRSSERVLFLGDSLTESFQVADDETFVVRVQAALSQPGRTVSCVNAGQSGAGPADYIYLAPSLKKAFRPTRTVVQVSDSDFGPSLTDTGNPRWLEPSGGAWIVGHRVEEPGRLSALVPLLPAPYYISQRLAKDATVAAGDADENKADPAAPDPRLLEWVVKSLREEYGDELVILYLPTYGSFDYTEDQAARTPTESLLLRTCERAGIGFVDVRDALCARYAQTRQPLHGFMNTVPGTGHLNREGHAVVAAELVRCLTSSPGPATSTGGGG